MFRKGTIINARTVNIIKGNGTVTVNATPPAASRNSYPGTFIALEGIDGAGKTWLAMRLQEKMPQNITVREPGSTPIGEAIRQACQPYMQEADPTAIALAMSACRRELTETVIRPALQEGKTVISDRWTGSMMAYQRSVTRPALWNLIRLAAGDLAYPDLTVLLTRDPRAAARSKMPETVQESLAAPDIRETGTEFNRQAWLNHAAQLELVQNRYLELAEELQWKVMEYADGETVLENIRQMILETESAKRLSES